MKKTYKVLVIWLITYTVGISAVGILPSVIMPGWPEGHMDELIRLIDCATVVFLMPLLYYIRKTGYAYYFSGISYEQASAAGVERCKAYAAKHVKLFGAFTAVFLCVSIIAEIAGLPWCLDFLFMIVGLLAVCIRSTFFKL